MSGSGKDREGASKLGEMFELIREEMEAVNEALDRLYRSEYPRLEEILRYLGGYRGKRIRPALVFLAGRACGELTPEHRRLAMVLEALHTATLIHDDIIDLADVRRKIESVNHRYGNERAVLLGDFLFAESFKLAVEFEDLGVRASVASLCRELCMGELLEVCHRFDLELSEAEYLDIIHKKTGILFEVGCGISADLVGAPREWSRALAEFGRNLGMAFQIVDDCLDIVGEETTVGKSLGNDVTHGMTTLPIIHFYRNAPDDVRQAFRERFHSAPSPERDRAIQDFVRGSDAVRYAYAKAEEWTATASQRLALLPATPFREALIEILSFVVRRRF